MESYIDEMRRWERLMDGEIHILAMLVGESDFHVILEGICRLIEAFNPEVISSVLLLDPDGKTMRKGASPSLPEAYMDLIEGLPIGPCVGSCGTAMYRAEQVIVTDITTDPLWADYEAVTRPFGLRACWSTPILSAQGKVEGTFALYFRTPKAPTPDDLKLVNFAARLTGVAIDRIKAHMELHAAVSQLEEARQAAEQANAAKSRFLASMSHELRTPLNAILLFSELMKEEVGQDSDAVLSDLTRVQSASQHLLALVNGILDLSKIEAGAMTVELQDVEVAGLLDELSGTLRPLVEAKGNRLEISLDPHLGMLRTDALKLRQILYNLIGNAGKFTEEGTITLRAERIAGWARFAVRDTGIGMSPEGLSRLFQEFSQAEADTARRYGGTGLGLTICKRLCGLLGGRIEVESQLGLGSTFTVLLPF